MSHKEAEKRGWEEFDVILISGDAYVDHPSFGTAVISRIIEDEGLRIGIVAQPNWQDDLRDFKSWENQDCFLASLPDAWIPWSITTQQINACAQRMPIPRWTSWISSGLCVNCL